jgi:hypothetical protein
MKHIITIPGAIVDRLRSHLFQDELEQGAFLFAEVGKNDHSLMLGVVDLYLVPPAGWHVQKEVYLEMKDTERAKIMKLARGRSLAAIDCHSHPGTEGEVWFSPSDRKGITEFAPYAKWKLDGQPFAAMVWADASIDAVIWHGDFATAHPVDAVQILADRAGVTMTPTDSWFRQPKRNWWSGFHGH